MNKNKYNNNKQSVTQPKHRGQGSHHFFRPFADRVAESLHVSMVLKAYLNPENNFIIVHCALSAVCLYRRIALSFLSYFCFTCYVCLCGASHFHKELNNTTVLLSTNPIIHSSIAWGQMHKNTHRFKTRNMHMHSLCQIETVALTCDYVLGFSDIKLCTRCVHRMSTFL